jgi:hypothetical protein
MDRRLRSAAPRTQCSCVPPANGQSHSCRRIAPVPEPRSSIRRGFLQSLRRSRHPRPPHAPNIPVTPGGEPGSESEFAGNIRPWIDPVCTVSAGSGYKTRKPVRSSSPSGASGCCTVGRVPVIVPGAGAKGYMIALHTADGASRFCRVRVAGCGHLNGCWRRQIRWGRVHSVGRDRSHRAVPARHAIHAPRDRRVVCVRHVGREGLRIAEEQAAARCCNRNLDGWRRCRWERNGACASSVAAQCPRTHREEHEKPGSAEGRLRKSRLRRCPWRRRCFSR